MQRKEHSGAIQRHKHLKNNPSQSQGQGPQDQTNWSYLPIPMPTHTMSCSYIGESGRSLVERVKEHLKAPSLIHLHSTTTGHPMDPNQFNIMHKEVHSQARTIKEAMFIRVQDPPLNRNIGKYQLPHIWDQLLQSSPVFQPKPT